LLRLVDSWIWDSWYAFDGEYHHAFYLKASRALGDPNRRHRQPYVGHAKSKDLIHWEVLEDALALSDPPAFDSWTTWTGSVVRDDQGLWWMFYTGTSKEDGGDIQRVGAATSSDLTTWSKVSTEALVEADPELYETLDYDLWHDQAWRDPFVFKGSDNLWHMLITARAKKGAKFSRGVAGHATSQDLKTWKVLEGLTEPDSGFGQMEVIQVEEIDGVPTMIWCCDTPELSPEAKLKYGSGGVFSVTGESLLGPFDPSRAIRFPHDSLYAARAVNHQGKWFLMGFVNMVDGEFVGELTDPIPLKIEGSGLVAAN
jgi:beta-fructofuranosidase